MSLHQVDREITRRRREKRSKMMRLRWADPEYRALQKAKRSAAWKAFWADPVRSAPRRAAIAAFNQTPGMRKASGERMRQKANSPAEKLRLAAHMKAMHESRPEVKAAARKHARENALKINARRKARRDVVPAGKMNLYRKLREAGITRPEALRQCWVGVAT